MHKNTPISFSRAPESVRPLLPPMQLLASLSVADKYDVQITIHTDTLNEAGYFESTRDAIAGRAIHTYHTEGVGGGHARPNLFLLVHTTREEDALFWADSLRCSPTQYIRVKKVATLLQKILIKHINV